MFVSVCYIVSHRVKKRFENLSVFGFLLVVTVNGLVKKYEASYALF